MVALGISLLLERQYSASASLLFRESLFDQQLLGGAPSARTTDPEREAATNISLVSLPVVARRTATRLPGLTAEEVENRVEAVPDGESDLVVVSGTDPSPRRAALLANTFATEYIAFRREADQSTIRQALRLVQLRLGSPEAGASRQDAAALRDRAQQLEVLASLQTGNVELVERAEPPLSPASPRTLLNTGLGLILGLGAGVGIAFVLESVGRRLRDRAEIEDIFDRPLLGAIPESDALAGQGSSAAGLPPREREAFQMLRASLQYFNVDAQIKSVVITSAASGDGKSTVSWNLARAAASARLKVLLIDADLRRGGLTADLAMRRAPGLSSVLAGQSLQDTVLQIKVNTVPNASEDEEFLTLLVAGPLPPNPTDLFESRRLREVLSEAEAAYDLVVIDTAPATVVSDAIRLVKLADGTVVVCRLGETPLSGLVQLRDQLQNLDARLLGVVLNHDDSSDSKYGYGYGYGLADDSGRGSEGGGSRWRPRWFGGRRKVPS